jgi:peroxiredoxin
LLALLSLVIIWQASNPSTDSRAPAVAAGVLVALVVANFGRGFVTEWRTSLADGTGVAQDAGQTPMASLAAGSQAPSFALRSLGGETVSLARLLDPGLPAVIVFSDPDCGPCSALLPKIAEWQREFAAQLTLAIVSRGTPEANRVKAHDYGLANVLLQTGREVASAYGVLGTPSAVLVTAAGRIGSPPAQGHADITSLVDRAARTTEAWRPASETPDGAPFAGPDQPLPDLAWSTLDGREIRLSDFRGRPTVLMFWNPSCGYCRKMLDDLKAWDARPATVRQPMIVVSAGPVTDNEAMGLRSPIVLDQDFAVGRLFGARGTPAAAVVDPTGVWDGHTAVGIPHVRALLASTMGEALPASAVPVRQESVEDELLGDGGMLLYHTTRRQVLTLNGTAALVWDCCDGRHSIDMIVEEVRGVFPSAVSAGQDTRLLIDRLLRDGMISLDTAAGESIASISPRTGASEAR